MPHPEHERAELVHLFIVIIGIEPSPDLCGIGDLSVHRPQTRLTLRDRRAPGCFVVRADKIGSIPQFRSRIAGPSGVSAWPGMR